MTMFSFNRKKKLVKYKDFFILWAANKDEDNNALGVTLIKAHKSKPCIPIFPTVELANEFIRNSPFDFDIISLSNLNTLEYPSDYNVENSLLVEMNQAIIEQYKTGEITASKPWRKYLR